MQVSNRGLLPPLVPLPVLPEPAPLLEPAAAILALVTVIVTLPHRLASSVSVVFSRVSTFRDQRIFTATHSVTYLHLSNVGSHSAGSWSPLAWFSLSVTATNVRLSARSLA